MENNIDNEVEKTLKSLDEIEQATLSPFFYTRLKARMNQRMEKVTGIEWTWTLAVFIMLCALNVFVVTKNTTVTTEESSEGIELLSQEYSVNTFDIYEDNQIEENE